MTFREFAAVFYLPLMVQLWIGGGSSFLKPDFEAILNQDGTWSITGEIAFAQAKLFDAEYQCLVDQLKALRPAHNPNPDNTVPMTAERMREIVCADPVAAPCFCPALAS
jgi:hypothetical protein